MRRYILFLLICLSVSQAHLAFSQKNADASPDTLLVETFDTDPSAFMLPQPGGSDFVWINYDEDKLPSTCTEDDDQQTAWFWESDLSDTTGNGSNYAYTSCSYHELFRHKSRNWLITPPVEIPTKYYTLSWRSMPFNGPAFMDGYKVLLSSDSNDPASGDFKDTLFVAAEMTGVKNPEWMWDLEAEKYFFSPGYAHANAFQDTAYYFKDYPRNENNEPLYKERPFLRGKMEPHTIDLSAYAGKTVYIAFLHDSVDDYLLQIDDIAVFSKQTIGEKNLPEGLQYFNIGPNPARNECNISWRFEKPTRAQLRIFDINGRLALETPLSSGHAEQYQINTTNWPRGTYIARLNTLGGSAVRRFLKI